MVEHFLKSLDYLLSQRPIMLKWILPEPVADFEDEAGEWSVCDSDLNEALKRSLEDTDDHDGSLKRPAVSKFTPRVVGESSGAVFDAIASSSHSQLPLQAWEHGNFGYIFGNNDMVPTPAFPVLEQPADLAPPPQMGTVDASLIVIDKDPVFTQAVKLRARWTCRSGVDARVHVLMRWRAALYHNLEGSETGHNYSGITILSCISTCYPKSSKARAPTLLRKESTVYCIA